MAENQYGFPTEVLSLPSQGLLYPEDSPLRSGTIDVKYMTAKEEDILTSQNLIEQGVVITRLIESVIADPKVKLDDMLIGDKNAIMVGTRILGYGKDYAIELTDPDTNERVEYVVDLSKLQNKSIDEKLFENGNNFTLELPNSKRVIGFKLLTHKDEKQIEETLKDYEKAEKLTGVSYSLTTRLKHQIVSIDGNTDQKQIDDFVDNEFLALDTRAFRKYLDKVTPDIELKFDYTSQTGNLHTLDVPLGLDFFWPAGE
jgi:Cft2 family RNA processing exonuclease